MARRVANLLALAAAAAAAAAKCEVLRSLEFQGSWRTPRGARRRREGTSFNTSIIIRPQHSS